MIGSMINLDTCFHCKERTGHKNGQCLRCKEKRIKETKDRLKEQWKFKSLDTKLDFLFEKLVLDKIN